MPDLSPGRPGLHMTVRWRSLASAAALGLVLVGCQSSSDGRSADSSPEIHFKDDAVANADPGESLANLEFVDPSGKKIRPRDFLGRKNLVLVFTRGYNGSICPYCAAYTSGLISNYRAMTERDAEVVVVY